MNNTKNTSAREIYQIISPSGSRYVGMTTISFEQRWSHHRKELKSGRHKCTGLKNAYNKYGLDNLRFEILEIVPDDIDDKVILHLEVIWWEALKSFGHVLYNACPSGNGSVHHSQETRDKIAESLRLKLGNQTGKSKKKDMQKCLFCNKESQGKYHKKCKDKDKIQKLDVIKPDFEELYLNQKLSIRKCEKILQINKRDLRNSMIRWGIEVDESRPKTFNGRSHSQEARIKISKSSQERFDKNKQTKISVCEGCNKDFKDLTRGSRKQKYCNIECYLKYRQSSRGNNKNNGLLERLSKLSSIESDFILNAPVKDVMIEYNCSRKTVFNYRRIIRDIK